MQRLDLREQVFGYWTVVCKAHKTGTSGQTYWYCVCCCGLAKEVEGCSLQKGTSTSCGCIRDFNSTKHGMWGTPTYQCWDNMMGRCYRPSQPFYEDYGGRGVMVCERWHDFTLFLNDMGVKPEGMTIDRINTDGHYEPNNCRWITNAEQQLNKRNNNIVFYNGMHIPITEAARLAGLIPETVISRQRAGKTGEDLFAPVR